MFKFFIKYVMQHTLFKESDSAKTSEQADNLILTTILSALRRRLTPTAYIANTPKQITALFVREKRRSVSVGKIHAVVRCVLIA